ncbi:MAG: hypothetical protein LBB40_04085 [Holophagales bacterium]|jgi:hypothetical protein|nr:hypothetical protein [Holophagales bacterium]
MKVKDFLTLLAAATGILGSPGLYAQLDKFETSFKMRTGIQATAFEDKLKHANYGFGAALGYKLTEKDSISLELGWAYKSGDERRPDYYTNLENLPTAPGIKDRPDWSANWLASGRVKNLVEGFAVRLAYERQFNNFGRIGNFGLLGGLQIGGSKFKHEYFGDIANSDVTSAPAYFRDSFYGTLFNNPNSISPFVGVTKRFGAFTAVELNVVGFRYESAEYVHEAGHSLGANADWTRDYIVKNKRAAIHFELGYVVRF